MAALAEGPGAEASLIKVRGFWTQFVVSGLDVRPVVMRFPRMAKKQAPIKDRYSKTQILDQIAADTGLSRKQVGAVIDGLGSIIGGHLDKKGVG